MIVSEKDFNELLKILAEDHVPSQALVRAVKHYQEMFGDIPPKNEEKLETATTFRRKQMDMQLVKDAVEAKICQGEMFTAYDITKVLRKNGWAKHFTVRDEVHRMFMAGEMDPDYKRTNGRVTSNDDYAWIYHHYMDDADDYINPSVSPANALSPTNVTPTVTPTAVSQTVGASYTKTVDNRGRLLIEKRYVANLGLSPGDMADVCLYGRSRLVVSKVVCAGTLLRVYIVDKDGAIRISSKVLSHIGSSTAKTITPGTATIIIE